MSLINAAIQSALGYSQTIDFVSAIMAAGILYLCRLKHRVFYGLIEVIVGLYLASFSFATTGFFSSEDFDPKDFDVVHLSVTITTYLGAIFVMVRGFDNIHSGWKSKNGNP